MNDDTTERLELKIAFLERASAELSDVVYAQQRQIETLQAKLVDLASRLEAFTNSDRLHTTKEEKPLHY